MRSVLLRTRPAVLVLLLPLIAGCATSFESVQPRPDLTAGAPCPSLGVAYSRTFFQERYMGKSLPTLLLLGPLVGAAVWQISGDLEKRTGQRLAYSDFERSLGDFDVAAETIRALTRRVGDVRLTKIAFTEEPARGQAVVDVMQDSPSDSLRQGFPQPYTCAAAFKVAYGIGARQGGEQFGFRKAYRPFIRVIGSVKRVRPSPEVLWSDAILVFGSKAYTGGDADADKVPRSELLSTFRQLTAEVVDTVVKSMNGEPVPRSAPLVDTTQKDLEF